MQKLKYNHGQEKREMTAYRRRRAIEMLAYQFGKAVSFFTPEYPKSRLAESSIFEINYSIRNSQQVLALKFRRG